MKVTESSLRKIIRSVIRESEFPSTKPKELRDTYTYHDLSNLDSSSYRSPEETMKQAYPDLYHQDEADEDHDLIYNRFTEPELYDMKFYQQLVVKINQLCEKSDLLFSKKRFKSRSERFDTDKREQFYKSHKNIIDHLKQQAMSGNNCVELGYTGDERPRDKYFIKLTKACSSSQSLRLEIEQIIRDRMHMDDYARDYVPLTQNEMRKIAKVIYKCIVTYLKRLDT